MASSSAPPITRGTPPQLPFRNWGRCWGSCSPSHHVFPASVDEVVAVIRNAADADGGHGRGGGGSGGVRVVGAGYSPNDMTFTAGTMLHMDRMNRVLSVDVARRLATVEAGCTMTTLSAAIDKHGLVLPTALSVTAVTVAGAAAVAAHGSGATIGTLSRYVVEVEGVSGGGDVIRASALTGENAEILPALRCHLGLLVVVTRLTLQLEKRVVYRAQCQSVPLDEVCATLAQRVRDNKFYKLVWIPDTPHCYETCANPVVTTPTTQSGSGGDESNNSNNENNNKSDTASVNPPLAPVVCSSRDNGSARKYATELAFYMASGSKTLLALVNRGFRHVYLSRAQSFVGTTDHLNACDVLFQHATVEWAVPARRCVAAIRAWARAVADEQLLSHLILEVRFCLADDSKDVWLSTAQTAGGGGKAGSVRGPAAADVDDDAGFDANTCCYLGIVMFRPFEVESPAATRHVFDRFQRLMRQHGGRPHWAKYFSLRPDELASLFPRWGDFERLRRRLDPHDLFVNRWFERVAGEVPRRPLQSSL